jgi:ferredoxin
MKVRVEKTLCQGHSMCALACPEIFKLNEDDGHAYVADEDVPLSLVESVRQAERGCPEGAVKVDE